MPKFSVKTFFFNFFGLDQNFGRKNVPIFSKDLFGFLDFNRIWAEKALRFSEELFFWSSPELGQKKRPNFERGLFLLLFGLLLVFVNMNKAQLYTDGTGSDPILKFKRWRIRISSCWIWIG